MTEVFRLPTPRQVGKRDGRWPTLPTRAIADVIETCRLTGQLGLITGPSGIGKTTAARAAVGALSEAMPDEERLFPPTFVMASMTRASEGMFAGLQRIVAAAGITVGNYTSAHELHETLTSHVWSPKSLIVLDEAQFMSDALLDAVRNLSDELESSGRPTAIVLIGTPDLTARIKGRGKRAVAFEPLRGRLGAWLELPALDPEDIKAVCAHHGWREKQAETMLWRVASQSGGLHNVHRIIRQAQMAAGLNNSISYQFLLRAIEISGVSS